MTNRHVSVKFQYTILFYTEVNQVLENPNHEYFGITHEGNLLKPDSFMINETNQLCYRKPELFQYKMIS